MRKRLLGRCLLGAPLGLALSVLITIAISLTVGDGRYYAVVPELIDDCGSEIAAVTLQAVVSLLYGAAWAGASLVWECERWSLLRQTATHLLVCSAATFPAAYCLRWMRHSVSGVLLYFGLFLAAYLIIWLVMYAAIKKKVRQMNSVLQQDGGQTP